MGNSFSVVQIRNKHGKTPVNVLQGYMEKMGLPNVYQIYSEYAVLILTNMKNF